MWTWGRPWKKQLEKFDSSCFLCVSPNWLCFHWFIYSRFCPYLFIFCVVVFSKSLSRILNSLICLKFGILELISFIDLSIILNISSCVGSSLFKYSFILSIFGIICAFTYVSFVAWSNLPVIRDSSMNSFSLSNDSNSSG